MRLLASRAAWEGSPAQSVKLRRPPGRCRTRPPRRRRSPGWRLCRAPWTPLVTRRPWPTPESVRRSNSSPWSCRAGSPGRCCGPWRPSSRSWCWSLRTGGARQAVEAAIAQARQLGSSGNWLLLTRTAGELHRHRPTWWSHYGVADLITP
ncbi:hypothetical protein [Verrucosispora sp. ts21]|uniref:hypothetical protein n=1 Tax=Verrucosispora sp. ts21 TaxID=2069341 RepID=UPI001E541C1D|nr:hypothetical protein [Verrucosispora sp. ts21]